mmetsp:Transcript_89092/g.235641  ORF Transcript_89092/g.235641 Transcript_89092/m.235641 type:complete len:212 (+) Transcript_89092:254-889(+)
MLRQHHRQLLLLYHQRRHRRLHQQMLQPRHRPLLQHQHRQLRQLRHRRWFRALQYPPLSTCGQASSASARCSAPVCRARTIHRTTVQTRSARSRSTRRTRHRSSSRASRRSGTRTTSSSTECTIPGGQDPTGSSRLGASRGRPMPGGRGTAGGCACPIPAPRRQLACWGRPRSPTLLPGRRRRRASQAGSRSRAVLRPPPRWKAKRTSRRA